MRFTASTYSHGADALVEPPQPPSTGTGGVTKFGLLTLTSENGGSQCSTAAIVPARKIRSAIRVAGTSW
ncbi:hypothetical protein [Lentzea sp. NBRC 102530]|uniref:hypothetical protein n=1 Tax=Lentzea sp. NBRC 102530 TaxID=3032201 RepID=UPI002555FAE2|nr:hypothetical protein [Lentzea sp. NBRC 102530]